jgi:hypothetical protein
MSAPTAPLIVARPRATDAQLEFWWAPPASGAPITNYTLACPALSISNTYAGTVGYASVTGIPNKTDVTFTLTATNANGTGPAATFRTVQCGTAPYTSAVATVTATAISTSIALVNWTPSSLATQAQTKWYVIRAIPANFPITPSTVQSGFGTDTQRYVNNLSANTSYQFLIKSINDVGWARTGLYTSTISTPEGYIPPFTPTLIPGAQIWLDANASSNFTFSSGSNISSWLDRSGKSQNTSNTAGTPVYSTINGTSAVSYPTASVIMTCGTSTFNMVTASTFSAFGMVNYTNGAATGLANIMNCGNVSLLRLFTNGNGSNTLGFGTNANDFALNYFVNGTYSTNAAPKFITLNTAFQFSGINQANNVTATIRLSDLQFSRGWIGYYNEIIFYSGAVNPVARQVLEGYLAWKWNRVADLPAGHPYKSAAPTGLSPLS